MSIKGLMKFLSVDMRMASILLREKRFIPLFMYLRRKNQSSEVDNFDVYGNDRYICQYISEKYPEEEIKFDISKIKLVTIDIY